MSEELDRAIRLATEEEARRRAAAEEAAPLLEARAREAAEHTADEEQRLSEAARSFVSRATLARIPPDGRVVTINGIKPSIFKRRTEGWCIREGSSMSWGGGHPAVYVLNDGTVINAVSGHTGDKNPRRLNSIARLPAVDVTTVIEEMGRYLASHGA